MGEELSEYTVWLTEEQVDMLRLYVLPVPETDPTDATAVGFAAAFVRDNPVPFAPKPGDWVTTRFKTHRYRYVGKWNGKELCAEIVRCSGIVSEHLCVIGDMVDASNDAEWNADGTAVVPFGERV